MPRPPKDLRPDASRRHHFGSQVRHWRLLRGLTQDELGEQVHLSGSKIGKVETAARPTYKDQARALDSVLGAEGAILEQWEWAQEEETTSRTRDPQQKAPGVGPDDEQFDLDLSGLSTTAVWRADAAGETTLVDKPWTKALADLSIDSWRKIDRQAPAASGPEAAKFADVSALSSMASAFDDLDRRFGGGYSRRHLAAFLADKVAPRIPDALEGARYSEWMSSAARLTNIAGFMAFDAGAPGLAQRYFGQSLSLAAIADDQVLGAHILSDMAMQAVHGGHIDHALGFAELGRELAIRAGSWATAARCAAMAMRAHARRRDTSAMWRAMADADRLLERAEWADEPERIRFFTHAQFCIEVIYASAFVNDRRSVLKHIPDDSLTERTRQHVLMASTVASVLLDPESGKPDVDQGCLMLTDIQPHLPVLSSARVWSALSQVRLRLEPFASVRAVRECQETLAGPPIFGTP